MVIKFRNKYLTSTATKIHLLAITANYLRKESITDAINIGLKV